MISSVQSTGVLADPKASDTAKLKAVAKQFEAVFLRQILGASRQTKLADDIFGSDATDQFREMQDSQMADTLAEKGSLGVADLLIKQFAARLSGTTTAATTTTAASSDATATGASAGTTKDAG